MTARAPERPRRGTRRASRGERLLAGLLAATCLGMLIVGAILTPDPAQGTATQLGMFPCPWPVVLDQPCPTCGMTTAVSFVAHGEVVAGFRAQPFGAMLALGAAVAFWGALHVALTGSMLAGAASRLLGTRGLCLIGAAFVLAWVYKVVTWH